MKTEVTAGSERGISKVKLVLGAASLFFFVIGVKRSFRTDSGEEILSDVGEPRSDSPEDAAHLRRNPESQLRNAS
jgi:hypothetical protein